QHAGSKAGRAPPKETDARCERDRGAEIDEDLACGHTLGYRLPDHGEIALGQALDSDGDQERCKSRMTRACDAHRPSSVAFKFIHPFAWFGRAPSSAARVWALYWPPATRLCQAQETVPDQSGCGM